MSIKLLPPQIESTLPAFTGSKMFIPITMNKAVALTDIAGFKCRIKSAIDNEGVATLPAYEYKIINGQVVIEFDIDASTVILQKGQFYKVQIAYVASKKNGAEVGFFSTVGVIKYCDTIEISISGTEPLNEKITNNIIGTYVGNYHSEDASEKIFKYRFDILDDKNNILESTGWNIHMTLSDISNTEASDTFSPNYNFINDQLYIIRYSIITVNGLELTREYKIMQHSSIKSDLQGNLVAVGDNENANIKIYIQPKNLNNLKKQISGAFVLSRLEKNSNSWKILYYFSFLNEVPYKEIFTDYTVEQNVTYTYSIQQYNDNNIFTERILSNKVVVNFEDMFLFDGKKQLAIKYNPKVSSFKNIVLEQKLNTIGSQYPYIFRNGYVKYKEFPISGLLSYKIDNNKEFIKYPNEVTKEDILNNVEGFEPNSVNLTDTNISVERKFKLAVLDWLTDGKPKLFKSPTEGNYLVRLLNVNLTPNDTLGRMIHTFSCNASEISEYSYTNLIKTGIISAENLTPQKKILAHWENIPLRRISETGQAIYTTNIDLPHPISSIFLDDMDPGSSIILYCKNKKNKIVPLEITIGETGSYSLEGVDIYKIEIPIDSNTQQPFHYEGNITYMDTAIVDNEFEFVKSFSFRAIPDRQFFGYNGNISDNILSQINNIKDNITKIYKLHFSKICFDYNKNNAWNDIPNENIKKNENSYQIIFIYEDKSKKVLDLSDANPLYDYNFEKIEPPTEIYIGNGIKCNISYTINRLKYTIEDESETLKQLAKNLEGKQGIKIEDKDIIEQEYLDLLNKELKEYKEEHGLE